MVVRFRWIVVWWRRWIVTWVCRGMSSPNMVRVFAARVMFWMVWWMSLGLWMFD